MLLAVQQMHSECFNRCCARFVLDLSLIDFHTYTNRTVLHVEWQGGAGSLGSLTSDAGAALLKVPVMSSALFLRPHGRLQHIVCICPSVR